KARLEYAPLLRLVDKIGINTYNDHAARFLIGNEVPKAEAEATEAARKAAAGARDVLKKAAANLEQLAARFNNRAIRQHILLDREYALKLATFYEALVATLVAEGDWAARRETLKRMWDSASRFAREDLRGPLYDLLT